MLMDVGVVISLMILFMSYCTTCSYCILNYCFSPNKLLSRMAPEIGGHAGNNPPPPPEPDMAQVLQLMLDDREAARPERQANLATLQHLA
jgi:hypothetical protein